MGAITANFKNSTFDQQQWSVKDINANVVRLTDYLLQPSEAVAVELQQSGAGYGDAKYWHAGQSEAEGSEVGFITGGQTIEMY